MKTTFKPLLGIILGLILGIVSTYLYLIPINPITDFNHQFTKVNGEVPIKEAHENIKWYQDKLAYAKLALNPDAKVKGIIHDTTKIKQYYDSVFSTFVSSRITTLQGYHWEVGLYPNVVFDPKMKKHRLNVYFIPTMVRGTPGSADFDIKEYFEVMKDKDSICYTSFNSKWRGGGSYIFDQGTLFP